MKITLKSITFVLLIQNLQNNKQTNVQATLVRRIWQRKKPPQALPPWFGGCEGMVTKQTEHLSKYKV